MKRIGGFIIIVAATLALVACSSDKPSITKDQATSLSKAASSASAAVESAKNQLSEMNAPPATDESPVKAATVDDLAAKLGCASVTPGKKMYALSAATCTFTNGHRAELAIFASNGARDQYVSVGLQVAPAAVYVTGDKWFAGGLECTEADLAPLH